MNRFFCQIESTDSTLLTFGCIYRSPASSEENNSALCALVRECQLPNCCLVGDFNFPDINWQEFEGHRHCDVEFLEAVTDCGFFQHVTQATRLNPDHILDLVLTNDERSLSSLTIGEPLGNSDHCSIVFGINFLAKHQENVVETWDLSHADWSKLCCLLSEVDWAKCVVDSVSINQIWAEYEKNILSCMSQAIPRRHGNRNRKKPMWATNICWKAINLKKAKYKKWKKNRTYSNKQNTFT